MLSYSRTGQWQKLADVIAQKFALLEKGGCDFGVLALNTPHKVFQEIQQQTSFPLISIVGTACRRAVEKGLKKLCLLGTGFTMKTGYYQKIFNRNQIELFVPNPKEIEYIHEKIFSELEFAVINPQTRHEFLAITERVISDNNNDHKISGYQRGIY